MTQRAPYLRDRHGADHGMNLPDGKTCGDCDHIEFCRALFKQQIDDEKCDFSPSRFRPAA